MPAEWEPHRGTWLSWPHKEASWPGKFGPVPAHLRRMVRAARRPRGGAHQRGRARRWRRRCARCSPTSGADTGNVFFHDNPTNDAWCRDHGPIFVQRGPASRPRAGDRGLGVQRLGRQVPALRPRRRDPDPHRRGARPAGVPSRASCMEGGSIDVNGRGTLLTTEACLLNPNRNPQLDRAADRGLPAGLPRRAPRSSGWATASSATTPTATSTTSPGSWTSGPS